MNAKERIVVLSAAMVLACGSLLATASGAEAEQSAGTSAQRSGPEPFVVKDHAKFTSIRLAAGDVEVDTMHVDIAATIEKLKRNKGRRKVLSYQCRGPQREVVARFRPFTHRLIIFPYHLVCQIPPEPNDPIWPGMNHLLINRLREIRRNNPGIFIYASLQAKQDGGNLAFWGGGKRDWTYQEQQWRMFAVIGADFDGILWNGGIGKPWQAQLAVFTDSIKPVAADLGAADPVRWVRAPEGQPCSALASKDKLFVVLLHPDYMQVSSTGREIALPLSPKRATGRLSFQCPEGIRITGGATSRGLPVRIRQQEGATTAGYRFAGGGEMLVFDLARTSPTARAAAGKKGANG